MADISDKIREVKESIDKAVAEEKLIKARITELRLLIDEKKKKDNSIAALKKQEEDLLKELENL
jgi:cell shape-determining protein MreC